MQNTWITLLPALIILITVAFTKKIVPSLLLGILSAAIIATNFSFANTIMLSINSLWGQILENIIPLSFTITLGCIVTLIRYVGGGEALAHLLSKKIKNRKQVEVFTLTTSLFLFLDDYLNSLTVGCAMQPLTDKFKIPRVKLAFLIDSMASALCIVAPVSTWIVFLTIQLAQAGISLDNGIIPVDPFKIFLKSVPFIFYAIFVAFTSWFIVLRKISYGPMKVQEDIALSTGNLYGGKKPFQKKIEKHESNKYSLFDFILPITLLMVVFVTLITIKKNLGFAKILLISGQTSLITSTIFAIIRKKLSIHQLPNLFKDGFKLIWPSLQIIALSGAFSKILINNLKTGQYLASVLLASVNSNLLPVMFFISSSLISLSTGSSWGAIAIMTPIAIPAVTLIHGITGTSSFIDLLPLFPVIGALLSGSISGAHLCPISDTVTIASVATGAYQLDHLKTQVPYIIPPIFGSIVGYLIVGYLPSSFIYSRSLISIFFGLIVTLVTLYSLKALSNKKSLVKTTN